MAKIYNKIVESTTEPSKEDLWLKEGKIKKFKNGWEDISGESSTIQDTDVYTSIGSDSLSHYKFFYLTKDNTTEIVVDDKIQYLDLGMAISNAIVSVYVDDILVVEKNITGTIYDFRVDKDNLYQIRIYDESGTTYYSSTSKTYKVKVVLSYNGEDGEVESDCTGEKLVNLNEYNELFVTEELKEINNKFDRLGTAAYTSVEEIVELVKQSINA